MTVDPGFGGTGWAFWRGDKFPITGCIREKKKNKIASEEDRLSFMWSNFKALLATYKPIKCYLERPEFWNSAHGMVSASSGSLLFLQGLTAGYAQVCQQDLIEFKLIPPRLWKGQLDKVAVAFRVLRINKTKYPNHITDAVAMGFSLMGML